MNRRLITRLLPFSIDIVGRRRDVLMALADRLMPLREGLATIDDGLIVDPRQPNQRLILHFFHNVLRSYRRSPLWACMRQTLHPGELFLDVGANLGFYSYLARKHLGCDTWLFEPEPAHAAFLRRNAELLGAVHEVALSDRSGEAEFHVGQASNRGGSSLVRGRSEWARSGYDHTITARLRRLDEVVTAQGDAQRIGMIKIDVEGGEIDVIRGMAGLLERARPRIWCEVRGPSSDRNPGSYRAAVDLLAGWGYRPWVWTPHRVRSFRPSDVRRVFDLLFLPA